MNLLPPLLALTVHAQDCTKLQGCNNCLSHHGCAWSKVVFRCQPTGGPDTVLDHVGCRQMNQQQGVRRPFSCTPPSASLNSSSKVFPAIKKKSPAGVITPTVAAEFARISNHIFHGEESSKTSGRHTSASWTAANPGSRLLENDPDTHIMNYEVTRFDPC